MTDTKTLKDKIRAKGYKISFVAAYLGISHASLSNKINNRTDFKSIEIAKLCDLLNIEDPAEKSDIFLVIK